MSKTEYVQFLASPSAALLADDASLHYVTTLTTFHEPAKIIKNLTSPQLKRKEQKVISAVEDVSNGRLSLEVETTIEFVSGGGAYLPGLDDNFIADRIVTLPIIHIVHFNAAGKIHQIRLHWDQASLLKHLEVIGARGRNWPIRDGPEQVRLIASSHALAAKGQQKPAHETFPVPNIDETVITSRAPKANGNVTGDPHASLSLFGSRENDQSPKYNPSVALKASARPPQRDFHDLFVGHGSDKSADATPVAARKKENRSPTRPESSAAHPKGANGRNYAPSRLFDVDEPIKPSTSSRPAPKGGAGSHYAPSRLFDNGGEHDVAAPDDKERMAKAHSTKYQHFSLDQGADMTPGTSDSPFKVSPQKYQHFNLDDGAADPVPASRPTTAKSNHGSQWDFADFSTPAKVQGKVRGQDVRHFDWSYEEDGKAAKSPTKYVQAAKPRRDAEAHFAFEDAGPPETNRPFIGRPRGGSSNVGASAQGLYENHIYDEDEESARRHEAEAAAASSRNPLGGVASNVTASRQVFGSHWEMADVPGPEEEEEGTDGEKKNKKPRPASGRGISKEHLKMMSSSWDMGFNETPSGPPPGAEERKENRGSKIKTSGDGMGGRRGVTDRGWAIGEEDGF